MYTKGDKSVSIEEAQESAAFSEIPVEEWAENYGWSLNEGKLNGSTETIPPTEPEKKKKKDGESTLEVTSSELPESRLGETGSKIIEARANVTAKSVADQIGIAYFNLEERDGLLFPKRYEGVSLSGFSQGQGVNQTFLSEGGLIDSYGEEKAKQWQALNIDPSTGISREDLKEKLDLSIVDSETINRVIGSNQTKQAEIVVRDMPEQEREVLRALMPSDESLQSDIEFAKEEDKAIEVGVAFINAQSDKYNEKAKVIVSQSAELKKSVDRRKEIVDSYTIVPGMDMPDGYQESYKQYEDSLNNYNNFISSESVTSLGEESARLSAASDLFNQRGVKLNQLLNETAENLAVGQAINKNYSMVNTFEFLLEENVLGVTTNLLKLGAQGLDYLVTNDEISNYLDNFKGRATQYIVNLETRRLEEIPIPLTTSDVESGAISQADFVGDVLLNNSPTILTVMGPAGIAKGIGMATTRKLTGIAAKEANKILLKRAAQLSGGMFFGIETSGSLSTTDSAKREARKTDKVTGLTEIQTLSNVLENKEYSGQLEKNAIEERINALTSAINVSEIERASVAILKGGTAMYAERLGTLRSLKNLGSWSKQLGKAQFAKYFNPSVARWASKTAGAARGASQLVGMELIEEGLTLASHNFLDISVLDMNKSVTDGMDKDFLANVILPTLAIGGPGIMSNVGSAIRSEYLTKKQSTESANIISDIFSMQDKLETTNMSEYDRSILDQKKMDALNQLSLNDADALISAGKLDSQDLEILADLQGKLSGLRSQAMALGADGVDSKELQNIKDEISEVVSKREAILESNEEAIAEKVKGAQNEAEALMRVKAYERNKYVSQRYYGDKYISIEETSEENKDPYSGVPNSFIEKYSSDLFSAEARGDFGFFKDGYAIIFEKNAIAGIMLGGDAALFASTAPIHEIAHGEIAAKGLISDVELSQLGNRVIADIKETLEAKVTTKEITSAQFETFLTRLNAYQNLATKRGTSIDAEEVMMIVGDMKAGGILSTNDFQALPLVKAFVNSTLNKVAPKLRLFVPLNNYADVSAFFNSFQNKVFEGGVKAQTRPPEEGEGKASLGTLLEDINALLPDEVTTRDQFFDRKVFNPIYNDGNLHPAIANYIRSRSVSKEESQKIIDSVADRLINFNPEAKRKSGDAKITLGEFIFSNVNFGKLDARKALFEESQETARTQSTDTAEAKEIVAAEESSAQVQDKPVYRTLLQRRVLDPDVIESIKSKVKSVVRVMKTRMDESVSKNVTVKPYIAELRKTMGKQADIDLKKAMGGKKDGQLRKFLLRNKSAILENMTTTWLMTSMPNAVQKKVNDAWTSDWKGKKIDRETVSADNAGRTSGAEMVRRLPNASTKLSDADFLSNILQPDGNPIRGRKESLAKAIAEEISFDIINEALQDPNSDIAKALETNQESLGVELTLNYVAEVARDVERGNVKFSIGAGVLSSKAFQSEVTSLVKLVQKNGISSVLNEDNTINKKYAKAFTSEWEEGVGFLVNSAYEKGLIEDGDSLAFGKLVSNSDVIPNSAKPGKALTKRSGKNELDIYAKDAVTMGMSIGKEAIEAADVQLLGFFNRMLDPAKKKKETGKPGAYYNELANLLSSLPTSKGLPSRLNVSMVALMNKSAAVMKKIAKIQSKSTSKEAKIKEYEESGLIEEIAEANRNNKLLAKYIAKKLIELVKSKKIAGKSYVQMLQAQTNAVLGFRALSGLEFITFKSGAQGNMKGEHLADNSSTMFALAELAFEELTDAELDVKLDDIFSEHDQWLENREVLNYVDAFGKNNPNKSDRILLLPTDMIKDVYHYSMQPATEFLNNVKRVRAFDEKVDIKALEKAREELDKPNEKMSAKASLGLSKEFNNIIERKTGVESYKTYSEVQAKMRGAKKGKFKFFIVPGADDFRGLVNYAFAGKGLQGEKDMKFFEEKLLNPYFKGIAAIESARQAIRRDYTAVKKLFKSEYKMMKKKIGNSQFTYDQAVRVYLWEKQGTEIPGVSKRDLQLLRDAINKNPELKAYADAMLAVSKRTEWLEPSDYWTSQTILSDLNSMTEKIGRKKYLEEFIEAADAIFTKENLNKIEALYGTDHKAALEDSLYAMKNGSNRPFGKNKQVNNWLNWINGSTGAIMFFNRRSALLQMLSFTNFTNWTDNNPLKQAAAFANQKQYWSDFAMIFNSDKLKERRSGLKTDVSESEIANAVANGKGSPAAALNSILKLGFTPTQIADSFAIASGGATFYRNRVSSLMKQGLTQQEAETRAMQDFQELTEQGQQSSRPDMISQQQASPLGRYILAFKNTPMQYARLIKKSVVDLAKGRGDAKTHISKIIYYGVVQNLIFNGLQAALGAMIGDEDEEKEAKAKTRVVNGMIDSLLAGLGFGGNIVMTVKNSIMEYLKQKEKGWNADHTYTILKIVGLSPTIGSKIRKIYSGIQTEKYNEEVIKEMSYFDFDNPVYEAIANVISGVTNLPLDRLVKKVNNVDAAITEEISTLERLALLLGWNTWDLGIEDQDVIAVENEIKEKKQIKKVEERKVKKEVKKKEKIEENKKVIESNINKQEEEKKEGKKDIKCAAVNKSGKRCGTTIEPGKSYCTIHEKAEQGTKEVQCKKIKKDKKRCGMMTKAKSGLCYYHD